MASYSTEGAILALIRQLLQSSNGQTVRKTNVKS
jgi:hypothetical protein